MTQKLTQEQFAAAQRKIDNLIRTARAGSDADKAAAKAIDAEWESANALPSTNFADREARAARLFEVAQKNGLI